MVFSLHAEPGPRVALVMFSRIADGFLTSLKGVVLSDAERWGEFVNTYNCGEVLPAVEDLLPCEPES